MKKRTPLRFLIGAAAMSIILLLGVAQAAELAAPPPPGAAPGISAVGEIGPNSEAFDVLSGGTAQDSLWQTSAILEKHVSLNFIDTEVVDILRVIRAQAGLNMIMDPKQITGRLTLHLENVRLGTALTEVLKTNKLAYVIAENSNIVRISSAADLGASEIPIETAIIPVQWGDAVKLALTFKEFATPTIGMIVADAETNSLIITDTPVKIRQFRDDMLKSLDRAQYQVLIEARLVEMQVGALREFGSEFNMWRRDAHQNSPVIGTVHELVPGTPGTPGAIEAIQTAVDIWGTQNAATNIASTFAFGESVAILGKSFNLSGVLTAYEDRNIVEVLVNPRVVTTNGVLATMAITQKIPYVTAVQNDNSTAYTVEFENAGVTIEVTPTINASGHVRMLVDTSQDIDVGRVQGVPVINQRKATTNVIVRSEDTVMIGGLRTLRLSDQRRGVPWLSNIPVLGWLFKHKLNDQSKVDLYIFVTPTVLEAPQDFDHNPGPMEMTSGQQGMYDRIDLNWELPDYFFDDVKVDEDMD